MNSLYITASKKLIVLAALSAVGFLSGCLGGPSLFKQDGEPAIPTIKLSSSEDDDGVFSAELDASLGITQVMSAADGSDISGSSVSFPAGSLAFSTTVSMQSGTSMTSTSVAAALGVASLSAASSSVVVAASTATDASSPFTVQIGLSGTSLRFALNDPYAKLTILYKVMHVNDGNKLVLGMIPRADLTIADGKVSFQTLHFGQFQAVYTDEAVTTAKAVETTVPILTKAAEKKLDPIVWTNVVASFSAARVWSVSGNLSGVSTLRSCFGIIDRDKAFPWDRYDALTTFINHSFTAANEMEGDYYAAFECTDDVGRVAFSTWSSMVKITKVTNASSFSLTSVTPASGTLDFEVTSPIVFGFNDVLNTTTGPAGIQLFRFDNQHEIDDVARNYTAGQTAVSMTTANGAPFSLYTQYTVRVTNALTSTSGVALSNHQNINFRTRDGAWDTTQHAFVSTAAGLSPNYKVATSQTGATVVFWAIGNQANIAMRSSANGTWVVTTDPGNSTISPWSYVYINHSGRAVVAWTTTSGGSNPNELRVCTSDIGSTNFSCQSFDGGYVSTDPFAGASEHDTAFIAWFESGTPSFKSMRLHLAAVNPLITPAPIGGNSPVYASIATNDAGQAAVLWALGGSQFASLFDPDNNTWGSVETLGSDSSSMGTAAVDEDGNAYFAWGSPDSVRFRRVYRGSGVWDPVIMNPSYQIGAPGNGIVANIAAKFDKMGNLHLAWGRDMGGPCGVEVTRLNNGAALATMAVEQRTLGTTQPNKVELATNALGNRVGVVWSNYPGGPTHYAMASIKHNGVWTDLGASIATASLPDIQLRMDHEGNATFMYSQYDGVASVDKVYAVRSRADQSDWSAPQSVYEALPLVTAWPPVFSMDELGRISALWGTVLSGTTYYLKSTNFK